MAVKLTKMQKKVNYDAKLSKLLDHYTQILVVGVDNVGSNQLQNIRHGLRGESVVLMGKNTMMKRTIRIHAEKTGNTVVLNLIPLLVVLNIPTKINKGTVEIITPVELIQKGEKVGSSEAVLLTKLGRKPFSCGLIVHFVYDHRSVFSPDVLNLTEDDCVEKFANGLAQVAAFSLAINYPALAASPHMIINGYKNLLSLAVATEYSFKHAYKVKEYLKDPSKFVGATAPVSAGVESSAPTAAEKVQKKGEPEESSEGEGGLMGLFD